MVVLHGIVKVMRPWIR